jgi:hypothetical protein
MQLSFSTVIATLAAVFAVATPATAQACPEATQFGVLTVSPTTLSPGDVSHLHNLCWPLPSLIIFITQDLYCDGKFHLLCSIRCEPPVH